MDHQQVQSRQGVTLVGGGEPSVQSLEEALKFAPLLVAADGGADRAIALGAVPELIIGDLDSVSEAAKARVGAENVVEVYDHDRTDFEKCLAAIEAPFVIAVGFANARLDHTLAVMTALVRDIGRSVIVLGEDDIVFSAPLELALDLEIGSRLSFYPLAEVRGRSQGLEWPLDPHVFSPMERVGTSNRVTGPVRVSFDGPGMLVITPREALAAVVSALTG
ncbi:MAG: thiamine diphosphokinase [Boseongicola sp.]|nr:thiamine diphosphokinase [Boseongicola sp.]